ncbi:EAL domain-containing protein [Burkholderia territorii]|uniref:EAL domain-containing protein n=1 Tax=Burkholderia territorii TaxID=1503055 RepID=UPI000ADC06EA|nr:EAL domain-containing protein [Burkholderia territorii]
MMCAYDMAVRVRNLRELTAYYGETIARGVMDQLQQRVQQVCGKLAVTVLDQPEAIRIDRCTRSEDARADAGISDLPVHAGHLDQLLASLGEPLADFPLLTLAILEARWLRSDDDASPGPLALHIPATAISSSLALVSEVMATVQRDRARWSFQPIRAVRDTSLELYRECEIHVPVASSSGVLSRASFMPSLERIGGEQEFDRLISMQVLDRLRAHADIELGYRIGAASAVADHGWEPLFDALAADADVASRLIIEVDEGALVAAERMRALANTLRRLGCRLAISQFGLRFGAQVGAGLFDPDIIKINPQLLWRARDSRREASRLTDTVALAQGIAPCVVLEGVESAVQLATATASGAVWVQGPWLTATILPADGMAVWRRPRQYA